MKKPILYFLHGWAFDSSFWRRLTPYLAEYTLQIGDSGYFTPSAQTQLPKENFIAIGHSMGFMRLLESASALAHCKGFIGINAFACFSRRPNFPKGLPERYLCRLQRNVENDPVAALNNFYKNSGWSEKITESHFINKANLIEGLQKLIDLDTRPILARLEEEGKILGMLSGRKDSLNPGREHWVKNQDWLENSGHLLPLHAPERCANWIKTHLASVM